MQKIHFAALILSLLLGCAPEAHLALADKIGEDAGPAGSSALGDDDAPYDDEPADAGVANVDAAVVAQGDAAVVAQGDASVSADASSSLVDAAADGGSSQADAAVAVDSGTKVDAAADAGPAHVDAGQQPPQPTVVWSKHHVATMNLGSLTTQPYHRARFTFSVNGCAVNLDSPFYATGWTGTSIISLSGADRLCLRDAFDCSTQATVQWGSCASSGCGSLAAGAVWQTTRPACAGSVPASAIYVRLTIAQLGAGGIDETWEVVSP